MFSAPGPFSLKENLHLFTVENNSNPKLVDVGGCRCNSAEMPSYAPLVSLAEIITGTAPRPVGMGRACSKFIQIKDLDKEKRNLVVGAVPDAKRASPVREGDVLLAARGEQAAAIVATPDLHGAFPTLDVYLIRPGPMQIDPDFLVAWLGQAHVIASLRASTTGVLIPRIPVTALRDLRVPLPRLSTQAAIGALATDMKREQALLRHLSNLHQIRASRQLANVFASMEDTV